MVLETVSKTRTRSGWTVTRILRQLGLAPSVYYHWRQRTEQLEDKSPPGYLLDKALEEEITAVVQFALEHPREGYRRLTWMMVDQDVAYLSPSSVYRILSERDLLCRYKPPAGSPATRPEPPQLPHQRWHTDLMYLWLRGRWYFLVSVLDAYSRYIVHWELLWSMRAEEVTEVVQRALEKHPGEHPEIVHDRGSQYTGKEFRRLTRRFDLQDIPTRLAHPQSNGVQERWFRSLRQEGLSETELKSYAQAQQVIGEWVEYYNEERLHGALQYLPPLEYLSGEPEQRVAERRQKLSQARKWRRECNRARLQPQVEQSSEASLALRVQSKVEEKKPRPDPQRGERAACSVTPPGARVALQQSPILQRSGDYSEAGERL